MNQMRLNVESDKARIKCLESEKSHLEIINRENVSFKEKYKAKCEQLEDKIMELNRESSVFKKDIVAIDELKRDRDIRIKEIRSDLDILQAKFETL